VWTYEQKCRLAIERQLVARYFPQFAMSWWDTDAYFEGWQNPSDSGGWYLLRLVLPSHYPHQKPRLYVISPNPLLKRCGCCRINDEECSHSFHTWEKGPDGCVQICHTYNWDASQNCITVLLKGVLWIQSYLNYWRTGEPIAAFLREEG